MDSSQFPPPRDGVNPSRPPLSDETIYAIAAQIIAAVRRRRRDFGEDDILAAVRELPWADEERVTAAVLALLDSPPSA